MQVDGAEIKHPYRLALITSQAFSIANFRGPLVRELVQRGVQVYALAPDFDDASRAAVQTLGAVPIEYAMSRTGLNPLGDILGLLRLVSLLRRLKVNVVFAYFIKPVIYGIIAARLAAVPKRFALVEGAGYVFTDDEKQTFRRKILRDFVTRLYRLALSQAELVFMLNRDDKDLFIKEKMVAANKVKLLDGIGLELDQFRAADFLSGPVCFILIARLIQEKGIYNYIEAARKVKALFPEVRFILLGNVDLNPGSISESEIHKWVAEGLVDWPGHVVDVRPWIAQASVFVLPSYYREGLPRSTQEAMAMGRPVITTDMPGCRETVEPGINGFLVPIRDSDALAEAMLHFVRQPELIKPMGIESRRIAEAKFDVHKINGLILTAIGLE